MNTRQTSRPMATSWTQAQFCHTLPRHLSSFTTHGYFMEQYDSRWFSGVDFSQVSSAIRRKRRKNLSNLVALTGFPWQMLIGHIWNTPSSAHPSHWTGCPGVAWGRSHVEDMGVTWLGHGTRLTPCATRKKGRLEGWESSCELSVWLGWNWHMLKCLGTFHGICLRFWIVMIWNEP